MPPVELPLGRKLPLLISGLIVLVLVASSTAAYIEVERSATTSADERVTGLAKQLADMVHTSIVSRSQLMRKVASDTAVLRLLRSRGTGALDRSPGVSRALERLVVPTDSAGFVEVWDQYGHPRARYDGAMSTLEEITETEQRQMLVARETPPGALDSIHTGPFYARGDSVFTWYVQPVVSGGLTTGFVAQRIRLTNDPASRAAQVGLRTIMGPGVDLYLANTANNLRTTTIGELSSQPPMLKAALGPVMYRDPLTGEMLGAKASVPATSWIVQIAMRRSVVLARPLAFLKQISVIALAILLIGALLAWIISREVTQPLAELTAATNDLSTGEYQRRVRINRGDELGRLGEAFNAMAQRVAESRAASEQQHAVAEAARREAVAASQAKSDFLAVMSHELRTPLNAILGFSSLMLDGITGPVNDQQRAQLARIRTGGQHLLSLIDEILSLSRLEAQREELHIEHSDAILIARETAALVEPMAALKGLALVTNIPAGSCECRTDVTKLRQILLNLLSNAIKFTNEGAVTFGLSFDEAQMMFDVSDTGIGIAPEHRGRIFEPFYQVEMSKARRVAGTGLGLSVTRHLARLLGGEVDLCGDASAGSTFLVWLPRLLTRQDGGSADRGTGERLAVGCASTPRQQADQRF
ncbi:MAG TPA: HAMP domain-containing sensor histidine kinase [Gemmatimonadaceae bacterium]|nr:HAMP domain-containing sensor histidine kinase [Gemmatimonadaceae bacterium]